MGNMRIEVWDPPGIATFERRIAGIQGMGTLSGTEYRRQVGRGLMVVPADYPRLGEIINVDPANTANMAASTIRVYRNDDLIKEFLVSETPNVISDSPTSVYMDAIEMVMDWAVVEPWDWDGTADFVSSFPDWVWGGRNVLVDPTFASPTCNPRISEFWTDATSGNWTVNVNGAGPVNVAFNIGALALEAAYQTMVADVLVEGSGANTDPWRVTFVDPCFPTTYVVTSGTLNGVGIVQTLIDDGDIVPVGWTESKTLSTGVPITFGDYSTFEVDTPPTPAPSGTNTALHVVGTNNSVFHFPGAQTTPSVTPGGLYQAGVWVYPVGVNQDFRLVLRPLDEEPLIASSTWPSVTLTANTWTLVPITDAMIPEGIDRIIFRIAAIENSANFWVTDAYLEEGQAPTTVGDIVGELLADAQTDHAPGRETITFIDPTFDVTIDSAGVAWAHSEVRISIPRGMTYRKMLEALLGPLGYEWSVTPSVTPGTWELNIWNPGGRVVDVTAAATPSLLTGQGTLAGYATRQLPRGNRVVAEGEGGYSSRAEDTASQPAIGVREAYRYDPAYMADLVDEWADEILARFVDESYAPRFDIADPPEGSSQPVPMVDYGIATRLNVDLADGSGKVARDVEAVSWRDSDQGLVWTVHTGMAQFDQPTFSSVWANQGQTRSNDQVIPGVSIAPPETTPRRPVFGSPPVGGYAGLMGPVAEGTRWLLDNFDRQRTIGVASALAPAGGGGAPTVVVAAADATDFSKGKADFQCTGSNDELIINQAITQIDPGGRVLLTEGTFSINVTTPGRQGVYLNPSPPNRVVLQGMGFQTRLLQQGTNATGVAGAVITAAGPQTIRDLMVECDSAGAVAVYGVHLNGWFDAVMENVWVIGGNSHGVVLDSADEGFVNNCQIEDMDGDGISFVNCQSIVINGCDIRAMGGVGVDVQLCDTVWVRDCTLAEMIGAGITVDRGGKVWLLDNWIDQAGADGILAEGTSFLIVRGNTIQNSNTEAVAGAAGIRYDGTLITGDVWPQIEGNIVENFNAGPSILIDTAESITVKANQIQGATDHGISVVDSSYCLLEGNYVRDWDGATTNTFDGINLSGDSNENTLLGNVVAQIDQATVRMRYAINISAATCDDNAYLGNRALGTFATGDYNDAGTGTVNTWPAAGGAQGDNLT